VYEPPGTHNGASVEVLDHWILRATEAILTTWDATTGNFWRDSLHEETDAGPDDGSFPQGFGKGKGATSNNRAFHALCSVAYFLAENEQLGRANNVFARVRTAIQRMVSDYYLVEPDEDQLQDLHASNPSSASLALLRQHGENGQNPYTDAQLLLSISLALSPVTASTAALSVGGTDRARLAAYVRELTEAVEDTVREHGVKVHANAAPHHFLTYHAVRGLDAATNFLPSGKPKKVGRLSSRRRDTVVGLRFTSDGRVDYEDPKLVSNITNEIVQQLGLHMLPTPGFDPSSLVSSCGLVARLTGETDSPLIKQALEVFVADQSQRGTWPSAGVLSFGRRRLVYVPSVELSLVLANLCLMDLRSSGFELLTVASTALERSFQLVQTAYSKHGTSAGWRNDRARSSYEVESWTTSVVLQFLLAYRECLGLAQQKRILRKYRATRPKRDAGILWADLQRLLPGSRELEAPTMSSRQSQIDVFRQLIDPTSGNVIVNGIAEEILEAVASSPTERPDKTASFMLYGPPGTRKTSLVERMAETLGWPLLSLSPAAFLKNGIEGFESAADEVFEDLFHLRRVVVLFDECEEFFRNRTAPRAVDMRTAGAFITSGMLPRLQRLRDLRWIVFVINSNTEAFELDEAVTRRGRLDKAMRVGHPVYAAQMRYLQNWGRGPARTPLTADKIEWFRVLLEQVSELMDPKRDIFEREIESAQKEHPDRGPAYYNVMTQINQRMAKEITKTVTFSILDALAERCVAAHSGNPIVDLDSLRINLDQEFERSGPDKFGGAS